MDEEDADTLMRMAAFERVRRLAQVRDHLTAADLAPGFVFNGERIPLVNPQRGIYKPAQMRFLLSVKTVFPKPGGKVWYDDQREVHRQTFEGDEMVDYAFMGRNADAADNRWLREAFESQMPIIYFLGFSPGRYQAVLPAFISGWDRAQLKARIAFGVQDQEELAPPETAVERRYALRAVKQRLHQASFREAVITEYGGRCAQWCWCTCRRRTDCLQASEHYALTRRQRTDSGRPDASTRFRTSPLMAVSVSWKGKPRARSRGLISALYVSIRRAPRRADPAGSVGERQGQAACF